ncbi:ferritin-like domain-containing protein [Methylobacterium sp. ID0610]|uniref:ferritin-like domain-containing protein n=1 Tax=Methylobacterium carpenticola TaxID=3344827 RepID=UPI003693CE0D
MAEDLRSLYTNALKNTHALELQALQIMERQVERLERYPEMDAALRRHITETHGQRDRLEAALGALGESPSALKEGVLGLMGNLAALAHTPAQDEILKNAFANRAFENYEAAAYDSLIAIAEAAGQTDHLSGFQQSLKEELAMAQTVADLVKPTTRRYLELTLGGGKADR